MKADRELQKEIIDELQCEPHVPGARIGVEVCEGIVTLTGKLDSYAQKCAAEHAVQRVSGVEGVVLQLEVEIPGLHQRSDEDLARAARNALACSGLDATDRLSISVQAGRITLGGEIASARERTIALTSLRELTGVIGIYDESHLK